jgi:glycosyltransferase involved in cell wall biosynthesis
MSEPRNRIIYCGFGTYAERPPPIGGFVSGTRMVVESPRFDHTAFHLNVYTHPGDGGPVGRLVEDLRRFRESLRACPDHHVVMMQIGLFQGLYREWPLARWARRRGKRVVLDLRGGALLDFLDRSANALQRRLFASLLRASDLALVQCRSFLPELRRRYPDVRFEWFPNFMPHDRRIPRTAPPFAAGQRLRLVYFGAYTTAKGIAEMIEAIRRCRAAGVDVELHLAGEASDPDLARRVREARDHGVTDHGRMRPEALWDLLGGMHALLFPSTHWGEGHANTVNEALMAGLAIVATRHHELPFVLPEQDTLWLDADDLVQSLVERICFLAGDPEFVNRVGESNRTFLLERYTDDRWIPWLESRFDELSRPGA